MSLRVVIEADGGSRGNPGPAGYGAVVLDADTGAVLAERKEAIGTQTNNVAEYRGLIAGLQAAATLDPSAVEVRMDSKLVIEQVTGRWQVKHPGLRPLARQATALLAALPVRSLQWIPREKNKHADRLANEAMDEAAEAAGAAGKRRAAPPVVGSWAPPTGIATRLVLVRHGATEHSAAQRFSGRNDLPLNDVGRAQAAALSRRNFGEVASIVTSPLVRARQTAEQIASVLGKPVRVVDGMVETDFGDWEGLSFAEAHERDPDLVAAWMASPSTAPPGGESFDTVALRVRRARDSIIAADPGRTVLVVTHVTPIKTLLRLALDAPPTAMHRLHLDPASVSIADYFQDRAASVRLVNDTSHLG